MKFTTTPRIIEAIKFIDTPEQLAKLSEFIGRQITVDYGNPVARTLSAETTGGLLVANEGEWIIKSAAGHFHTCPPGIFETIYKPVEEPNFQQRVIAERDEEKAKLARLDSFIANSPAFASLDIAEQTRLRQQSYIMEQLVTVLDDRIAHFK